MITNEYRDYTYKILIPKVDGVFIPLAYVKIPEGHPLYKLSYNGDNFPDDADIQPHGCFTYSGDRFGDGGWYLGWDYGHAGDLLPYVTVEKLKTIWDGAEDTIREECEREIDKLIAYSHRKQGVSNGS